MCERQTGVELTLFDDNHDNNDDYHKNDDDRNDDHSERETTNLFEQREGRHTQQMNFKLSYIYI